MAASLRLFCVPGRVHGFAPVVFKRKFYGFHEGARYEMLYFPTYDDEDSAVRYRKLTERSPRLKGSSKRAVRFPSPASE